MKTDLSSRLNDIAQRALRTGAPLSPADVETLKAETGATDKEIRTGFLLALKALEAGLQANESAGRRSSTLRKGLGDGVGTRFLGQSSADAKSTPALRGTNLKVPDVLDPFRAMTDALRQVARGLKEGSLNLQGAQQVLDNCPIASDTAKDSLWSPGGETVRGELNKAIAAVAFLAPELRMQGSPYSIDETALQNKITTFKLEGETELKEMAAQQLLERYPDSALAAWAKSEAVHDPLKGMDFDKATGRLEQYAESGLATGELKLPGAAAQFLVEVLAAARYPRFQPPARLPAGVDHADLLRVCDAMARREGDGALRPQDWGTLKELLAPWRGKEALPVFRSGAHTLEDCSLVIRNEQVLIDARRGDKLLAQGFTREPDTELLAPPRDADGWYQRGTYELPGYAKLVVGAHNDVRLDVTRMVDHEFDRVQKELPKRGFVLDGTTGLMSLPRA